jgi:hypothetical protein
MYQINNGSLQHRILNKAIKNSDIENLKKSNMDNF